MYYFYQQRTAVEIEPGAVFNLPGVLIGKQSSARRLSGDSEVSLILKVTFSRDLLSCLC